MAEVLNYPQFQIFKHQETGFETGRVYFPAVFLAEYQSTVVQWLESPSIHFDERDFKKYGDGSFRLYFRSPSSLKQQYRWLVQLTDRKAIERLAIAL